MNTHDFDPNPDTLNSRTEGDKLMDVQEFETMTDAVAVKLMEAGVEAAGIVMAFGHQPPADRARKILTLCSDAVHLMSDAMHLMKEAGDEAAAQQWRNLFDDPRWEANL